MPTAAEVLAASLEAQGVPRVFCVPGESFLALLDGLRDSAVRTVVCRQEGGAAMMAEATGKLTGRPGVAVVTRGPGASNALSGVHVAQQDSTPMVLLVGQVERGMRGRDAFQEVDYGRLFGGIAKWVAEVDDPDRVPELVSRAFHTAMSGRPGPVVLALPEDVLAAPCSAGAAPRVDVAEPAPNPDELERFLDLLGSADRPIVVAGGSRWSEASVAALRSWSERWSLPVACSFRRQSLFDQAHPHYAGDVGLGINPKLRDRIVSSDLLILLGGRFSENPSQSYTAIDIPAPRNPLVHVHPGAEELGRVYRPTLGINATPGRFLAAVNAAAPPDACVWRETAAAAHAEYLAWAEPASTPGDVQLGEVVKGLRARMPEETIVSNGAGNYAIWVHRFWRYPRYMTQLAPTSGSMGYGLPAAIAAKLDCPEAPAICFAGDGCFQMTMQEFGTAAQEGAAVVAIVVDNGMYGTIRMHQERSYPGRVTATALTNPDFAGLARLYGGHGETVTKTADFLPALERALAAGGPAILHLKTDPEAVTPSATLTGLREAAERRRER